MTSVALRERGRWNARSGMKAPHFIVSLIETIQCSVCFNLTSNLVVHLLNPEVSYLCFFLLREEIQALKKKNWILFLGSVLFSLIKLLIMVFSDFIMMFASYESCVALGAIRNPRLLGPGAACPALWMEASGFLCVLLELPRGSVVLTSSWLSGRLGLSLLTLSLTFLAIRFLTCNDPFFVFSHSLCFWHTCWSTHNNGVNTGTLPGARHYKERG